MNQWLELSVSEGEANGVRRRTTLLKNEKGVVDLEIFHESKWIAPFDESTVLDGHVLALLLYSMKKGNPLRIAGNISKQAMRNLHELQLIWTRWKPDIYRYIQIAPNNVISVAQPDKNRAIAAFSGGADATFTALQHTRVLPADLRYPLTDSLMVHGFDVDLARPDYFTDLQARCAPLLEDLGLNLRTIKTNSKDWKRQSWDDSFALELAACLHLAGSDCAYGLVGSSKPYEDLLLPWGSSPVSDHLMTGDLMTIVHDGAGYSRTDKIAEIAKHPIARRTIKVCWAGDVQSGNCCKCEKCVRTMLNFKAGGHEVPESFPTGLHLPDIQKIKIYNSSQMKELKGLIKDAKAHGIENADWMKALQRRMRKELSSYGPTGARKWAGKALDAVGAKKVVKSMIGRK